MTGAALDEAFFLQGVEVVGGGGVGRPSELGGYFLEAWGHPILDAGCHESQDLGLRFCRLNHNLYNSSFNTNVK